MSGRYLGMQARLKRINTAAVFIPFFFYYYWHIYPPITRKRRSAVRARLGVAGYLSTTLRWGNPAKCLFPTAQQVNLPAFSTLSL